MAELINGVDPATEDFASGPGIGDTISTFELTDAHRELVRFADRPPKTRSLILFYRSSSW
jgi:hypothetical protein